MFNVLSSSLGRFEHVSCRVAGGCCLSVPRCSSPKRAKSTNCAGGFTFLRVSDEVLTFNLQLPGAFAVTALEFCWRQEFRMQPATRKGEASRRVRIRQLYLFVSTGAQLISYALSTAGGARESSLVLRETVLDEGGCEAHCACLTEEEEGGESAVAAQQSSPGRCVAVEEFTHSRVLVC